MTPLPLPLALADELYRRGETKTPRTVADELVRMHNEIEATDRQVEILTDELTKCSKAYGGLQAENEALRSAIVKLHKAKGRYHTQLAVCDLFELCGLTAERPKK
jgi:hypothetical protein